MSAPELDSWNGHSNRPKLNGIPCSVSAHSGLGFLSRFAASARYARTPSFRSGRPNSKRSLNSSNIVFPAAVAASPAGASRYFAVPLLASASLDTTASPAARAAASTCTASTSLRISHTLLAHRRIPTVRQPFLSYLLILLMEFVQKLDDGGRHTIPLSTRME